MFMALAENKLGYKDEYVSFQVHIIPPDDEDSSHPADSGNNAMHSHPAMDADENFAHMMKNVSITKYFIQEDEEQLTSNSPSMEVLFWNY